MNFLATEARISMEFIVLLFYHQDKKAQLFFCTMQLMTNEQMANELINQTKKAIPVSENRFGL